MKTFTVLAVLLFLGFAAHSTKAAVLYVDLNGANPTVPYTNLNTAANDIQTAIDAASDGDTVLVSDGVYNAGGRPVYGILTNRIAINKAVTVQSVHGPAMTIIQGYQVPGDIYGANAVRCVYMTNNASLIGFTITNGSTWSGYVDERMEEGGGIWCESTNAYISNCVITANSAWDAGGGVAHGTLANCVIIGNSTPNAGGGALLSVLNDCVISNNFALYGGGAVYGSQSYAPAPTAYLNRCLVVSNYSYYAGGGVYGSICASCQFMGNSAIESPDNNYDYTYGGAAENSLLISCTLKNNYATDFGGGADASVLQSCLIISNRTDGEGGAMNYCQAVNCTMVKNTAGLDGGGASYGTLDNCIVYYNTAPTGSNFFDYHASPYSTNATTLNNSCTFPMPTYGINTFTNAPLLVDLATGNFHLQSNSPCINAGNNAANSLTADFDSNPRIAGGTIDVGCYEFQSPASRISYVWLSSHGLPTDGSADVLDPDGDGMNNWQEWRAGTDPTSPASVLKLLGITNAPTGLTVTWQSVQGVTYQVQRASQLSGPAPFSTVQSNIAGQTGTTSFTDPAATNATAFFYRVAVQ